MINRFQWIFFFVLIILFNCSTQHGVKQSVITPSVVVAQEEKINNTHNSLSSADSLYVLKKYNEAVNLYKKVFISSPHILNRPEYYFKMGFCYFSMEKSDSAIFWMNKAYSSPNFPFSDYIALLIAKSYKSINENQKAQYYFTKCANNTNNEYLRTKALWEIVSIKHNECSDSLLYYLNKINFAKLLGKKEEYILLKIELLKNLDKKDEIISFSRKLLKSDWHSHVEDTLVSILLKNINDIENKGKINILKQLMNKHKNRYFDNWYLMLTDNNGLSRQQQAEVKFQKAIKLYKMKKWQSSSQMLKKINTKYLPANFKGDYALYVARCNARKGFQNTAIRSYYNFQKKYPRHRLAGDALWWIALTFEQRNDYKSAQKYYNILANKYFSKGVGKEARFRLIFNDIKQKKYYSALKSIKKIIKKVEYNDKMRLTYWKMYCLQKIKKFKEADELKENLLKDPFQNYYTIKVFLSTYKDSLEYFKEYAPYEAPSHYTLEQDLRDKIDRIFFIEEIMGKEFARLEIKSSLSNHYSNKNYRLILAELNNKLSNYGEAFRLNRRNYEKYFIRKKWFEKIGFIKNLYPLYYDDYVYPIAYKRDVDPLLIYALMKRESLFQARVKSYANAYGLMQILPSTARILAKKMDYENYNEPMNLYEPEVNINLGIYYLQNLLKQFNGSLPQVLASYNAGESRVERWEDRYLEDDEIDIFIELIPIDQTRKYVKYVLYYYYVYQWFYRLDQGICYYQPLHFNKESDIN